MGLKSLEGSPHIPICATNLYELYIVHQIMTASAG